MTHGHPLGLGSRNEVGGYLELEIHYLWVWSPSLVGRDIYCANREVPVASLNVLGSLNSDRLKQLNCRRVFVNIVSTY